MKNERITIRQYDNKWQVKTWTGTIKEAMDIALVEISEHAGGDSPTYIFTNAIFNKIK